MAKSKLMIWNIEKYSKMTVKNTLKLGAKFVTCHLIALQLQTHLYKTGTEQTKKINLHYNTHFM